jgi:hypothetical protein
VVKTSRWDISQTFKAISPVNLSQKSFRIEWSFAFDRHDSGSLSPVSKEPTFSHHKSFFVVSNIEQIAAR